MLFLYLFVSVVRTRTTVERIITVLVSGATVVALGALVQRETGQNLFDHLHAILPGFNFNPEAAVQAAERGGNVRANASAGHPDRAQHFDGDDHPTGDLSRG